jgi:hypothetical protein
METASDQASRYNLFDSYPDLQATMELQRHTFAFSDRFSLEVNSQGPNYAFTLREGHSGGNQNPTRNFPAEAFPYFDPSEYDMTLCSSGGRTVEMQCQTGSDISFTTIEKTYPCHDCPDLKGFATSQGLADHAQLTKHRPYKCMGRGCGKTFDRRDTFARHMRTHNQSHVCKNCEREFKRKDHLKKHRCHRSSLQAAKPNLPLKATEASECLSSSALQDIIRTFTVDEYVAAIRQMPSSNWLQVAGQQTMSDQSARISSLEAEVDELKAKVAMVADSEKLGDA